MYRSFATRLNIIVCGLTIVASLTFGQTPASTASVSPDAVVESITFEGLSAAEQSAISAQLSVRTGAKLSYEARQRIAAELRKAGKDIGKALTFSYTRGATPGSNSLKISNGC